MIQVDIGGHPPTPFGLAPSILAALHIQHHLLFLAGFWVLHSRSRFGALMIQVDIGGHPPIPLGAPPLSLSVFFHNLLFLAVFCVLNFWSHFEAPNGDSSQNYVPGKLKHQFTQTRPIVLAHHLLGLGFGRLEFSIVFSIINRHSSLIVTQFRGL